LTKVGHIVVMCLSPIGDALFATPAIRALRGEFPRTRITILTSPAAFEVLRNNPFQVRLIKITNGWQLYKVLVWIRKQPVDLVLGFSRLGNLFTKLCGGKQAADFSSVEFDETQSVVEVCLDVLRTVVGQAVVPAGSSYNQTDYWLQPGDYQMANRFLDWSGYEQRRPLVAIHCGGHYFTRKRWPVERFIQLVKCLIYEAGHQTVLIGGKEDRANAQTVCAAVPETLSAVGILQLSETGALLKQCDVLIGNDSGPLHVAAALRVPTVALFGPTQPCQFYPYPGERHRYLYKDIGCNPCYHWGGALWQRIPRCSRSFCMEAISVAEVLAETCKMINLAQVNAK
jgi:ADP-heptose:LPS heptosyltransferase